MPAPNPTSHRPVPTPGRKALAETSRTEFGETVQAAPGKTARAALGKTVCAPLGKPPRAPLGKTARPTLGEMARAALVQMARTALVLAILAAAPASGYRPAAAQHAREAGAPRPVHFAQAIDTSRALILDLMHRTGIPGITVAVSKDGLLIWSEGFGYADVENRVPVWPHTKMRIGSVSKSMTAAGMGILMEQGLLDLDATVQRYVPYFPEKRWPITSRMIAGHLAGIRHYRGDEFLIRDNYPTVQAGIAIFAEDTLLHEPGSAYAYSSYGFNLLSAVVEGASGESFLPFMRKSVFWPLGMHDTVADHPDSLIAHRPRYYEITDEGELLNAPYVDLSYKWAGGGFLSTAPDLIRFGQALLENRLFSEEIRTILFTSQQTNEGEETGYGVGFATSIDDAGRRVISHGGGSVGGTTGFMMVPDEDFVLAIIANVSSAPFGDVPGRIMEAFLDSEAR